MELKILMAIEQQIGQRYIDLQKETHQCVVQYCASKVKDITRQIKIFRPNVVVVPTLIEDTTCIDLKMSIERTMKTNTPHFVVLLQSRSSAQENLLSLSGIGSFHALSEDDDLRLFFVPIRNDQVTGLELFATPQQIAVEILQNLSFGEDLVGYGYLRDCIVEAVYDSSKLSALTKELYTTVAIKNHTSLQAVEHAMRFTLEKGWERAEYSQLEHYFGKENAARKRYLTAGKFISILSNRVKNQLEMRKNAALMLGQLL